MITFFILLWIVTAGAWLFLWIYMKGLEESLEIYADNLDQLTDAVKMLAKECVGIVDTQEQFQNNLMQVATMHNALNDDYLKLKGRLGFMATTIDEDEELPQLNKDYNLWIVQQVRAIFERLRSGKVSAQVLKELEEDIVYAQHHKLLSTDQIDEITNILLEAYDSSTNGTQICRLATKLLKLVN
jgi:small-conductance mechanosensitive channel